VNLWLIKAAFGRLFFLQTEITENGSLRLPETEIFVTIHNIVRQDDANPALIPMPDTLTKMAYQAFQDSKNYFGLGHKAIATHSPHGFVPTLSLS